MALYQVKKRLMALAGLVLTGYIVLHMLSNLSFVDPTAYEAFYAFYNQPFVRWPLWILVVAALLLHIIVAVQIRMVNRNARKQPYFHRQHHWIPAWLVSIIITLILLFIVWHMAQMWAFEGEDIYEQTVALFNSGWQVAIYLSGLALLGLHLQHSLLNVLQTLGKSSRQNFWLTTSGVSILMIGFAVVPFLAYWKAI